MNKDVNKLDRLLTSIKNLLKKHWGIILLLLFGAFAYWLFSGDEDAEYYDEDAYTDEYTDETDEDTTTYDSESYEKKADSTYIHPDWKY